MNACWLLLVVVGLVAACDVSGTWVDRSGNVATLEVAADGSISAKSYSGTRWQEAHGQVIDGSSLWLAFHPTDNETGLLYTNCSVIAWQTSSGSTWSRTGPAGAHAVTDVHLIFSAHLDVGYTDLAVNVCQQYADSIYPANMALAAQLRNSSTPYAFTTHAALVADYLDGAAGCIRTRPNTSALQAFQAALLAGDLRWQAQSANYNMELFDASSFTGMLSLVDDLRARFNQPWGRTFLKSTDVAGISRAVVPLLAAAGRRALHSGTNGKCRLAAVPQAFTWLDAASGSSALALMTNDYGGTVVVPPHALIMSYGGDNGGPPTAAGVAATYASARAAFPGAAVKLSSFDEFAEAALGDGSTASLPVITSEIGDGWLYGAASDPVKMATYRETVRTAADAVAGRLVVNGTLALPLAVNDSHYVAFQRRIALGGPEHNGGVSIGSYLPQSRGTSGDWANTLFHPHLLNDSAYQFVASSYAEKRALLEPLDDGQPPSPAWAAFLQARAQRVAQLQPTVPDVGPGSGFQPLANVTAPLGATCPGAALAVAFAADGSLASLVDAQTGYQWVPPLALRPGGGSAEAGGLLRFSYRTYTEADFATWTAAFTPGCGVGCPNFAKQGMDSAAPVSRVWLPSLSAVYVRPGTGAAACTAVAQLTMDATTVQQYGGAAMLWLQLDVPAAAAVAAGAAPVLNATLAWVNKTVTRLAEASFLSIAPYVGGGSSSDTAWLRVLGSEIDPRDVVVNGTRWVHATDPDPRQAGGSFGYAVAGGSGPSYTVSSLDAFLVSLGDTAHLLNLDGEGVPDVATGGWHINLHNDLWGTSFAQWFGDDASFRVALTLRS